MRSKQLESAADLAERTADAFESGRLDWGRRYFISVDEKYCVIGGLMVTELGREKFIVDLETNESWTMPKASDEVRRRIRVAVNQDVYAWNDYVATKEDVIRILKIVAKDLRNSADGS